MSYVSEQALLNTQFNAALEANITECARRAPHVILSPRIMADGDMWCMLLGENLQVGVCGFGRTPAEAAAEFDRAWNEGLTPTAMRFRAEAARLLEASRS